MPSITAILTAYRRPDNMKLIVDAVRSQSKSPSEVWLWHNYHEDSENLDYNSLNIDKYCKSNHNWKFFGRFAMATMVTTEYIAFFDDDTVPGIRWFENCLKSMTTKEGLYGSAGVILQGNSYNPHTRVGWPAPNRYTTEVDLVGHTWFMRTEWIYHMWSEKPPTFENGEDIFLSYMLQKHNIMTYCPPHINLSEYGSTLGNKLGIDNKATSNNNETSHVEFFSQRDMVIRECISRGWAPLWKRK